MAAGSSAAAQDIPDRPEELVFPDFVFETPDGSDYHHEAEQCGIPVVVVEDRTLPLIRLGVTLQASGASWTRRTGWVCLRWPRG